MAATVVIEERNETAPGIPSLDPANLNMGSSDASALTPGSAPITAQADGHAYEKWLRLQVSNLGGSTIVDNFKIWISNLGGGWAVGEGMSTNLRTTGYVATTAYVDPVETDSTVATQAMPESEPSGPNLGIASSLSGQITTYPAYTDFAVLQLDVTELTPAGSVNQKTVTVQYDEQ